MMNANMKRNSSQDIHTGNGAFTRQMAGRIMLSSMIGPNINRRRYDYHICDIAGQALTQGIAPGAEYPLAMAVVGLKNQETAIQRILQEMSDNTQQNVQGAAAHILCHMDQHRKNLNEISLLPGDDDTADGRMRTYIYAFAGAMEAGAEELFLSLDGKRLAHTLPDDTTVTYRMFQMLPFFEDTGYIFHALVNKRIREGFDWTDPRLLCPEEKKMLGSRKFLSSRIMIRKETVCACAGNPEAFRLLKYLSTALRPLSVSILGLTKNAGKLTDAEPCIRVLTYLDGHPDRQTRMFLLLSGQGYDKRLICAADKKLREDTGRYLDETAEMSACMEAAWLLDRDDVLAFQEAKWWDSRYEDIILHAMTHKWDRFLGGLNGSEALRDAAWYLRGVCGQINANLFSNKQLEAVSKQDLLPKAGTVPEWMGNVTYDQLLALKEIRQISPAGYRKTFMAVFQKLSEILKPEAAAKRMAQFAGAWNTPVMDYLAEDIEIEETAVCLAECDMYAWCRKVFSFKPSHMLAAKALPYIRRIPAFSEAETEQDAWFILRNKELCKDGLAKAKEVFCQTDPEVLALKEWTGIEDAFYDKYKKESTEFFMQDTAVANAYIGAISIYADRQKDAFRLIVKAAMCGKLTELKYHTGDLGRETGILMDERTVREWIRDMDMPCRNEFSGTCVEDSTFHGIMTMGARPFDTCMHYAKGSYRECLMSYFDANKKILYRIDGSGKTVARAVLRLTKASTKAVKGAKCGFSFVDVEDEAAEEYPILFLERMYSGYQGESRKKLAADLVRAARQKAGHMGFALVLADDYADLLDLKQESFHLENTSVYITRSKSSAQYLDSFGGMKTYDKGEDTYMRARCLVQDVR